jgi:hypothetical protein
MTEATRTLIPLLIILIGAVILYRLISASGLLGLSWLSRDKKAAEPVLRKRQAKVAESDATMTTFLNMFPYRRRARRRYRKTDKSAWVFVGR